MPRIEPWLALGASFIDGLYRRCVRAVQCGGVCETARARCYLEQRVIPALRVCSDQSYKKLGLRGVCGVWMMDRRVYFHDAAAPSEKRGCTDGYARIDALPNFTFACARRLRRLRLI
jgi:hypothetical protein